MTMLLRRIQLALRNRGEMARFIFITRMARFLVPQYRFKHPQMAWWADEKFNGFLTRFDELTRFNTDRRWVIHQFTRMVDSVPGDTAECGVFYGAGSYIILKANEMCSAHERMHFMFDSYEGLSAPVGVDGDYWKAADLSVGEAQVMLELADCKNFTLMKGWIPSRFGEVADRKFSFVHIDVDLYEPTRDSMAFFYERMSDGGIIIVDDYGFTSCPGATRAVDEVLDGRPEKMMALPDGGGFIIKGVSVGAPGNLS